MRVVVVGSGAREHSLAVKLRASRTIEKIAIWPGNIVSRAQFCTLNLNLRASWQELVECAIDEEFDTLVIGPELPLSQGIADLAFAYGLRVFGPSAVAAQLESSKSFAKSIMGKAGIPTAAYEVVRPSEVYEAAIRRLHSQGSVVVKADGLAAGKGVFVCKSPEEVRRAAEALQTQMAEASGAVVLEDCLIGREVSFFYLLGAGSPVELGQAVDYKRLGDGDIGPNTGGMGCYTPVPWLPADASALVMSLVVEPLLRQLQREAVSYCGFLYVGLMWTSAGPYVVEFNARLGDPEAQVLAAADGRDWGKLIAMKLGLAQDRELDGPQRAAVCVVMASPDYPYGGSDSSSQPLSQSVFSSEYGTEVYAASVVDRDAKIHAGSGRVLSVVGVSDHLVGARSLAYDRIGRIDAALRFRRDIASKVDW
jgi:phosphoribosylamine--glycine ligase